MTAAELATKDVVVALRDEPIVEAARRMRDYHVGDLIVVDSVAGRSLPVGILTDRDIVVGIVAEGLERVDDARVSDAMSTDLIWAHRDENIEDVLARMTSSGVRRVPVVDDDGCLCGVLAMDDLLALLSEELGDCVRLVARQRGRERTHFSGA